MNEIDDLYQQVIIDHSRSPSNFRALAAADRKAEGFNPLCGDRYTIYLQMDNGDIRDIGFQGSGCAISRASASMMTASVKGKGMDEIENLMEKFHGMLTGKPGDKFDEAVLGKLAVFSGVCEYPVRVKCATLPWHTLRAALEQKEETVSTEEKT